MVPFTAILIAGFEGAAAAAGALSDQLDEEFGDAVGSILRRGTGGWEALEPGADGEVLTLDAGLPEWLAGGGLAAIGDNLILANISGGSAVPVGTTLSALLDDIISNTQGAILTRNGGTWTALGPGTSGQYLKTGGAGANVSWDTPAGGGSGTSKVTASAVSLGSQTGIQSAFTFTTVPSIAARGLVSQILITASVATTFDVEIRGAGNSGGSLWLQGLNVGRLTYEVTLPFYYENDAAADDFFVGIRNASAAAVTFTLTALRVEKFA